MQVCVWRNRFSEWWRNAQTEGTWKELSQETDRRQLTIFFSAWWLHSEEHDTIFGAFGSALERCAVGESERQRDECFSCSHAFLTQSITAHFKLTSQFRYQWFLLNRRQEKTFTNTNCIFADLIHNYTLNISSASIHVYKSNNMPHQHWQYLQ